MQYNTVGWACLDSNAGEMKLGLYNTDVYFVCDGNAWREASTVEELSCRNDGLCVACTENTQGTFWKHGENQLVCDEKTWRTPNCAEIATESLCTANDSAVVAECEDLGNFKVDYVCSNNKWHAVQHPLEYSLEYWNAKNNAYNEAAVEAAVHSDSMITDQRDGNVYRTVVINGMRVFAENLRYADSSTMVNLKGQSGCYRDEMKNCVIGGRYYTWAAAMNLDRKWNSASASSFIGAQHRGVCPEGWHIPDTTEWKTLFSAFSPAAPHQKMGFAGWSSATDASGFSALPIGTIYDEYGWGGYAYEEYALFWSSSERAGESRIAEYWYLGDGNMHLGGFGGMGDPGYKSMYFRVRCIEDDPVAP